MRYEELAIHVMERMQGVTFSTSSSFFITEFSNNVIILRPGPYVNIAEYGKGILANTIQTYLDSVKLFDLQRGIPHVGVIEVPHSVKLGLSETSNPKYFCLIPIRFRSMLVGLIGLFREVNYHEVPDISMFHELIRQLGMRIERELNGSIIESNSIPYIPS
jgi:hypothetical protein